MPIVANLRLANCKKWRTPENPAKTTAQPQVTDNYLTCPGRDSNTGSGERQRALSGGALVHMANQSRPSYFVETSRLAYVLLSKFLLLCLSLA